MDRELLREMIDACRSGHPDKDDPELAAMVEAIARDEKLAAAFERSQRTDEAIGQAVRNVQPPSGAADRLLETLDAERPGLSRRWLFRAAGAAVSEKVTTSPTLGSVASTS